MIKLGWVSSKFKAQLLNYPFPAVHPKHTHARPLCSRSSPCSNLINREHHCCLNCCFKQQIRCSNSARINPERKMAQRKSTSTRPYGTDGSDFSYRMVVDPRYTKVAEGKSRLKMLIITQVVQGSSGWATKKFEVVEASRVLLGVPLEILAITTTMSLVQNMFPPKRT